MYSLKLSKLSGGGPHPHLFIGALHHGFGSIIGHGCRLVVERVLLRSTTTWYLRPWEYTNRRS